MYGDVVYNSSCRPSDGAAQGAKENGAEQGGSAAHSSMLPDVWVSVCRIKDRHYAALAYRYAACALLPYYRCPAADSSDDRLHRGRRRGRNANDSNARELLQELMTAAAAAGLEMVDDEEATSASMRQQQQCKQLGKNTSYPTFSRFVHFSHARIM